ncbi:MAG: polymerase epsilon subunit [Candidatus Parcubacteria bacterium]|jgi:DNA polymerase-3 subunit epsilon
MSLDKLSFVDIETSGARVMYDRIIEIGILRIENDKLVKTYQTLINPELYVSPFIEELTGIKNQELLSAPTFEDVKYNILELLDDSIFVAHNVRFDYGFLQNEFRRFGIDFSRKHFCTAKLSRTLFPQHRHHNLDALMERFKFECANRHRAFDDAQVLWDFYKEVKRRFDPPVLEAAFNTVLKRPSVPISIDQQTIDDLPEGPGVYIFYGENAMPLYVGKSINIRERVLSHFANDRLSNKEMNISRQIQNIEAIETAGELGALLKESVLVKEMQPLYNRQLRNSHKMLILRRKVDNDGFFTIALDTVSNIEISDLPGLMGVFRSLRQAKDFLRALVKSYGLCEVKLGLEKSKKVCFSHQLGWCKGACANKLTPDEYNAIFEAAFDKTKIRDWPFQGPILIQEHKGSRSETEYYLVDNWCLIGQYRADAEGMSELSRADGVFDLDTYKILGRYISSGAHKKNIKRITREELEKNFGQMTGSFG